MTPRPLSGRNPAGCAYEPDEKHAADVMVVVKSSARAATAMMKDFNLIPPVTD
jgi:hypothetical protein